MSNETKAVNTAVTTANEVPVDETATETVSGLINQQIIRVSLTQLIPFSGTLYDENGNPVPVSGNPFYVPEDYLPLPLPASLPDQTAYTAASSQSDTAAQTDDMAGSDTELAEQVEKKPDKDILSMRSLHASIEQEGILTPLLVRRAQQTQTQTDDASNAEEPMYEILSGYRRKRVCEVLSKTTPAFNTVPVIIVEGCDDDTASSIITSSNVQRKEISFLETIKSCGQMYRALRHRGSRNKKDEGQTADVVSQILGLKPRTVQRYSQLLELPERMLGLVGRKEKNEVGELRLPIGAGEVLSSLSKEKLGIIESVLMDSKNVTITVSTAKAIRKAAVKAKISKKEIEGILKKSQQVDGKKGKKGRKAGRKKGQGVGGLLLDENRLRKFCGEQMTEKEVAELIYGLVEKWSEGHKAE